MVCRHGGSEVLEMQSAEMDCKMTSSRCEAQPHECKSSLIGIVQFALLFFIAESHL